MSKKIGLIVAILCVLLQTGCFKGELVSKEEILVKVESKNNDSTLTLIDKKNNTALNVPVEALIFNGVDTGQEIRVTREVYKRNGELEATYKIIIDDFSVSRKDINNAKLIKETIVYGAVTDKYKETSKFMSIAGKVPIVMTHTYYHVEYKYGISQLLGVRMYPCQFIIHAA